MNENVLAKLKILAESAKYNDKEVTAETKFVPEKADGTVVVTFTFDVTTK